MPEQTVTVILTSNDVLNSALQEAMQLNWKICKYEFLTLDQLADREKFGEYYLTIVNIAGYSTEGSPANTAYIDFGKSNPDISKACKIYKKDKNKFGLLYNLNTQLIGIFLDPSLIHTDFSHVTEHDPNIVNVIKSKELSNAIRLNIKTVNWLLTSDLEKYFKKKKGTGKNDVHSMENASKKYNTNSCELKKMTLLVSDSDTIKGRHLNPAFKNFELDEFKKYYNSEVIIETPEKIEDYIKNDKENKYALLVQGVYERIPYCFIFRLSDGAILYGCYVTFAVQAGYTKKTYKQFKDICK